MAYTLTKAERETIITFNEASADAVLYTASPIMMRRMDKLCETAPENYREHTNRREYVDGEYISKVYSFPKELIKLRPRKRVLSEEQKQAAIEQLRQNTQR